MFCKLCLNAHNRRTALTHCVSNLLDRLARGVGGCFHEDLSAVTLVAKKPCICGHMLILGEFCVIIDVLLALRASGPQPLLHNVFSMSIALF